MSENRTPYFGDDMITATELKLNLGKYLDAAVSKKETVISKNGKAIARLVPYLQDFTGYLAAREEAAAYHLTKVSYEEFLKINDSIEARMEYINGEIIMQPSPSSFHQEAVGNLHVILKMFLRGKDCKVYLAPFDVTFHKRDIKTPDVIQPDLLIACDTEDKIDENGRYSGIPTLVAEVLSPSTRSRDMLDKLNTFMRSGCKEYWIIDVRNKRLLQYSFRDYEIDLFETYHEEDRFQSVVLMIL